MIDKIEKLRNRHKLSKAKLARLSGISTKQYYNYLNGAKLPCDIAESLLNSMSYTLAINALL